MEILSKVLKVKSFERKIRDYRKLTMCEALIMLSIHNEVADNSYQLTKHLMYDRSIIARSLKNLRYNGFLEWREGAKSSKEHYITEEGIRVIEYIRACSEVLEGC